MPQHDEVEILLVEDNADDVELCLHALRKEKLSNKIHVARDGQEALDFLFARAPHHLLPRLVLLDLKLPKIDGIQVLREVKKNPFTKSLPVVILTSSREERDLVESYELGVNSYLQKPVDFDEFRSMVKQIGFYWMVVNQVPRSRKTPRALRGARDGSCFFACCDCAPWSCAPDRARRSGHGADHARIAQKLARPSC